MLHQHPRLDARGEGTSKEEQTQTLVMIAAPTLTNIYFVVGTWAGQGRGSGPIKSSICDSSRGNIINKGHNADKRKMQMAFDDDGSAYRFY